MPHPIPVIGAVILDNLGRVLLGKRLKDPGSLTWALPGGKMELMESFEECLQREVLEETGLEVLLKELVSISSETLDEFHGINIGFTAEIIRGKPEVKEKDKCEMWDWFPLDELPEPLLPFSETIIENYKNGTIYNP